MIHSSDILQGEMQDKMYIRVFRPCTISKLTVLFQAEIYFSMMILVCLELPLFEKVNFGVNAKVFLKNSYKSHFKYYVKSKNYIGLRIFSSFLIKIVF